MKKNTIVRHCFSRKYISLCIFLLLGIIGEKAFAYSVWETYANETEGIYFSLQESIKITGVGEYYDKQGILKSVDGTKPMDEC